MGRPPPEEIEFRPEDPGTVTAVMAELATGGTGWVNVHPVIAEEHEPPPLGILAIFGGTKHHVPTATFFPGPPSANGVPGPAEVGLQHAGGERRIAPRLAALGRPVPETWRLVQDHPRRGLILRVPADVPVEEVLDWLVGAATMVCRVPMTGRWRATVYREATRRR